MFTTETDIIAPDGIIVIDNEGKIIAFSESAARITGFSEKEMIFQDYHRLFTNSSTSDYYILSALSKGISYSNLSLMISDARGDSLRLFTSITPIKPPDKEIKGVVLIIRNAEEMAALMQSLREKTIEILNEKNKLEAIFNSRMEGTFTIDQEWKINSFNTSAERITGYSTGEAIGKHCWEIFRSRLCRNGCPMESTMKDQQVSVNNELLIVNKDGKHIPIRINSAPLYNAGGEQIGGVGTFQDISEIKNLTNHLEERYHFENIIGRSKAMQKIYVLLENVAQGDSTVLITGESGTGKELVARAIHLNSDRRSGPFMALNCSAFVETLLESELFGHEKGAFTGAIRSKPGRFELANKGTLFLDEIGDITPTVQAKLLRVLETREFERVGGTKSIQMDVRIIAATNRNLIEEVEKKRFREDLYYRLNVFNIHLPPLTERIEDLPLLVEHFLQKLRNKLKKPIKGISPAAFRLLKNYHWPGNIRELENVLEHAFVLCHQETIQSECLPEWLWENLDKKDFMHDTELMGDPLKSAEKSLIQKTLEKFDFHRGKTAEALGIDKSTLWRKMKRYGLL